MSVSAAGGAIERLRLSAVEKSFRGRAVLAGVDLAIDAGEIIALLGPSGAGKTTLLKCIVGLEQPDRGAIYLNGANITRVAARERGIGLVFQNHSLFPSMTVRQNVAFPLEARRIRGMASWMLSVANGARNEETDALVRAGLETVRLIPHADKYPHQLSGGEAQRVALARAMITNPSVVCLDEPLSSLDKSLRQAMQDEIRSIQAASGATMVVVTHDQAEALALADRVAILNNGTIEQIGTPTALYERPANVFVATFLGECNILDVETCRALASPVFDLVLDRSRADRHVAAGIRPERLRVTSERPSAAWISGKVASATFMGSQTRLIVNVSERLRLTVIADSLELDSTVRSGAEVHVTCSADAVLCLSRSQPPEPEGAILSGQGAKL